VSLCTTGCTAQGDGQSSGPGVTQVGTYGAHILTDRRAGASRHRALQQSAPEEGAPRPPLPQQKLIKTKSRCDEERSGQMIGPGCRPVCEETCRDYHKGCRCKRTGSKCFRHFCADDPKAKELHTRFCICKCNGCRSWPPAPAAAPQEM